MSQLLSKIILDSIFSAPVPMFKNRDDFLSSMIVGRKLSNLEAQQRLLL